MDINSLVRENIKRLQPYASARSEFKGQAEVFLDANENPFESGYNRYPDPLQWEVKQKISALKEVPAAQIFLGNGSDEVIDLLIRIFCEPGQDHIVTLPPTYGMYGVSASIADVAILNVPLDVNFQPDVEAILEVSGAASKLLFLCSPNNPTGNLLAESAVLDLIKRFPGIVVIDEAYIDFANQESYSRFLGEYPNLVVMQTFSKAWGLAGIRLGMAFASTEIIGLLNKIKPPYNINVLTQEAALKALNDPARQANWVDVLAAEKEKLQEGLLQLNYVERIYPSDANFILVRMKDPVSVYHFLIEEKVIVRNRSTVLGCEGCLRISIGTAEENKVLLEKMEQYQP